MTSTETTALDQEKGQAAFEELRPLLKGLPQERLASLQGVDVELAATRLLQIGELVTEPDLQRRFERLPAEEFDVSVLSRLGQAARAILFLLPQMDMETLDSKDVGLSAELLDEAFETSRRMLQLTRYHFDEHPIHGPEIVRLGESRSVSALVWGLNQLASIYEEEQATIEQDMRHYRAGDRDMARRLAAQLREGLDARRSPEARVLDDDLSRCWTALVEAYGETRAAAQFIFRKTPELLVAFPRLSWLGRRSPLALGESSDDAPLPAGIATTPDRDSDGSRVPR